MLIEFWNEFVFTTLTVVLSDLVCCSESQTNFTSVNRSGEEQYSKDEAKRVGRQLDKLAWWKAFKCWWLWGLKVSKRSKSQNTQGRKLKLAISCSQKGCNRIRPICSFHHGKLMNRLNNHSTSWVFEVNKWLYMSDWCAVLAGKGRERQRSGGKVDPLLHSYIMV